MPGVLRFVTLYLMELTAKELVIFLLLTVFSFAVSFFFWTSWGSLLENPFSLVWGSPDLLVNGLKALVGLLLVLLFLSLTGLLISQKIFQVVSLTLTSLSLFLAFWDQDLISLTVGFSLLLVACLIFIFSLSTQLYNHVKLQVGHILGPLLSTFVFLFMMIMVIQSYFVSQRKVDSLRVEIPDWVFQQAFNMVGGITQDFMDKEKVQGATDVDMQAIFEGRVPVPVEWRPYFKQGTLPPELMTEVEKQGITKEQIALLLSNFILDDQGFLRPKEGSLLPNLGEAEGSMSGNPLSLIQGQLKGEVQRQLDFLLSSYRQYFPLVLSVLIFLILRSISGVLVSLSVILLSLVFGFLKLVGVFKIEKKEIPAERLVI